jgi:predicted SAM-dependent methyltransferase
MNKLRLNLGCSDDLKAGYANVDQAAPADQIVNLTYAWPWEDSVVDEIYAKDVFEHIEGEFFADKYRGNRGKIWVMNESHRVLKPGGILEFLVPAVHLKDGRVNLGAFTDPMHVSFWTQDDKYYFCTEWNNQQGERGRLGDAYGITALFDIEFWQLEEYGAPHERRSKLHARLRAVK